ncbi:sodium/hydrogen exchanger 2-like [Arachis ipaensis]|uniref:sodium/hydrogen exchanger 2-like n=1 Tax=Arachis ipaensis TaxID=130454 RepID=UPI0007AFB97D|nr:sodium/hydrogen exchanger 2-like [Arachis ipaensis]
MAYEEVITSVMSSDHASVVSMNLFVALLCACIIIGHLLEKNPWLNESITALLIGLCTGVFILLNTGGRSSHIFVFSEDLFFIYLLPPIIFNAGFRVKKKQFFRNFMTIILFGVVGTLISFAVISLGAIHLFQKLDLGSLKIGDYLAIGAIFSATDSVCTLQVLNQDETPLLYSLVFGEGVVNDATSVVLLKAIQNFDLSHIDFATASELLANFLYLFIASTVLGILVCLYLTQEFCSLVSCLCCFEVALMILMAYLSYMLVELFALSAILTMFFCGIVMSHYTWHNVTQSSRVTTKHAFATLSFIAEIFIFLYVGMDALDIEKWRFVSQSPGKSVGISSVLLGLILVGRAAFVFPLSFLSNLLQKSPHVKIDMKQQVTIWWSGLMRGAVSIALAYNQFTGLGHSESRENAIMITSTISVVLFSTVVFGMMTKPLVRLLLPSSKHIISIPSPPSTPKTLTEPLLSNGHHDSGPNNGDSVNGPSPNRLRMLLNMTNRGVHHYWRKFDDSVMRPVFGGRGFVPYVPGSPLEPGLPQWRSITSPTAEENL